MPLSLHQATTPILLQMLGGLSKLLDKASAHCVEKKIDPNAILAARLYPTMFAFQKQVTVATDWARNLAGMLAGVEIPKMAGDEKSFEDLKARVEASIAFVQGVDAAAIDAGADKEISWMAGPNKRAMQGTDFALHQALPQFFFHVTTAYAILRHNGVELAKRDFMGDVPRMKTL
ncbi:MAG: DUF1993 domain-containing protein [Beijerinckiaceae bacterium]|nr:DUF1993 domain-containing protein [Beijerinckiaceae bacterium]